MLLNDGKLGTRINFNEIAVINGNTIVKRI